MEKLMQLKRAVKDAVAPDPLTDFKQSETVRQAAGYHRLLRAVDATERATSNPVTVFIWSNQPILDRCGGNQDTFRYIQQKVREGVQALTRVRHPNALRVILPWTEDKSRHRCVFVTERIERWVADDQHSGAPSTASATATSKQQQERDVIGKRVESSYGMLQIGRVLEFLHSKVGMVLMQLSPASIVVVPSGDWKLADLTHAVTFATSSVEGIDLLTPLPGPPSSIFQTAAAPNLDYLAPEVVAGFEKLASNQLKQVAQTVPDLFDFSAGSGGSQRIGPVFADSDVFSFVLTVAAVVDGIKILNCGGEAAVYHRQINESTSTVRRMLPHWIPGGGEAFGALPRVTLSHVLQTECFASREVRLLSELPQLISMEPKAKLTLLKGFHDEISRGAFACGLLQKWVLPPLLQQATDDERMIKFVVPILLEASFYLSRSAFDGVLRPFLTAMLSRAIGSVSGVRDHQSIQDPVGVTLLAQFVDKFVRFWQQLSSPKDIQGLLGPLLCAGLVGARMSHDGKEVVTQSLKALEVLLVNVERAFPNGNGVARDVLSGVISCPEEAPRGLRCLEKLLPCTTRDGRETELEPKLVTGLQEMCKASSVSPHDVEQLLKVLMSIVAESTVEHVATVTLPLLCPLLIIRHTSVRQHISNYVNELVQLVIRKRTQEEQEEERQRQHASAAFVAAPSASEYNSKEHRSVSHTKLAAAPPPESDGTSFFTAARSPATSTAQTVPQRQDPNNMFGDVRSAPPPPILVATSKHSMSGLDDVFGF